MCECVCVCVCVCVYVDVTWEDVVGLGGGAFIATTKLG